MSPSWTDPPKETVFEPVPVAEACAALFDPVPWVFWVLLAFLLAEFVLVSTEPRCAVFEPVPLVFWVLPAFLLAEFVPVSFEPPGPLLLEPLPLLLLPFLVFEPWVVFMS